MLELQINAYATMTHISFFSFSKNRIPRYHRNWHS